MSYGVLWACKYVRSLCLCNCFSLSVQAVNLLLFKNIKIYPKEIKFPISECIYL